MTRFALLASLLLALPARADTTDVTTSDHVRLVVEDSGGEGEPVLLLHGLGASARTGWDLPGITRALRDAGFRTIAFDQRGHGRSGAPEGEGGYGLRMVDDCLAVLDARHVERAHVVGYSMGGLVALPLASLHPDRVRSVVLGGMGWLRDGGRLQELFAQLPGDRGGGMIPAGCMAGMAQLALTEEQVRAVRAPVSIVVGGRDPCRLLQVRPLEAVRPDWPVTVVEGEGHLTLVAKPALREHLLQALDAHKGT